MAGQKQNLPFLVFRHPLVRLFAPLLLLHGVGASILPIFFNSSWWVVTRHLAASFATLVLLFLTVTLLVTLRGSGRLTHFGISVALSTYVTFFVLLYAVNFITNAEFSGMVTFTLVSGFLSHLTSVSFAMPSVVATLGLCFTTLWLAAIIVSWRFAPLLVRGMQALILCPQRKPPAWVRLLLLAAPPVYLLLVTASVLANYQVSSLGAWSGDPLLSLLIEESREYHSSPLRLAVAAKENRVRSQYATQLPFVPRPVVVIVVDGLRPASMGVYGYERNTTPFLSDLQQGGKLLKVRWASSPCPESVCGILSILTSKEYRFVSHRSLGLHNIFAAQGYFVAFLLSGDHRWYRLDDFYGSDIHYYRDGTSCTGFTVNDDRCILQFLRDLHVPDLRKIFLYVHLMSAHAVGFPLQEFQQFQPATRVRLSLLQGDPVAIRNGYDNGVLQADSLIREIFAQLEHKGILSEALVIITADHGEGLGEHGLFGHTNHVYPEFIRVPLLIYDRTLTDRPDLEYGSLLDVAPTVLEILGLPVPETWQGRSLLQPSAEQRVTYHQTTGPSPLRAVNVRTPSDWYYYMFQRDRAGNLQREELYDLKRDPNALSDLSASHPEIVLSLRRQAAAEPW